jgi:hypothetical protein
VRGEIPLSLAYEKLEKEKADEYHFVDHPGSIAVGSPACLAL